VSDAAEQPEGTEACASVTSSFLQVLATVHGVESARLRKPRNVLHILSTNTRRTKVVEVSSGTHRVADDLRRHSLPDGEGGHYSTNLDRNRYGSDNNYLYTVTRYDLECLGMCPCLVDIEIVDTRNGNESQLVTAGPAACTCDSAERAELADASFFAGSHPRAAPASPRREMRRVASAGTLAGAGGLRRVASAQGMRRNPSTGRLYDYANGGGGGGPAHSRGNSGGSDLFDALLMAATGEHEGRSQGGEPQVSSRAAAGGAGVPRPRGPGGPGGGGPRAWQPQHGSHNDLQDSLQNAVDAFRGGDEGGEGGGRHVTGPRGPRMPRRNSVSMIVENPVLAQTGAADSLMMNHYFPATYGAFAAAAGGGEGREGSVHSGEGDTGDDKDGADGPDDDQHASFREGLLRHFHKQSSAANLSRMGGGAADARRLQEEVRALREGHRCMEGDLEEARSGQKAAEAAAAAAAEEAAAVAAAARRAADTIQRLKAVVAGAGLADGAAAAAAATEAVAALPAAGAGGAGAGGDPDLAGLRTSEQEIELLRSELANAKASLARAQAERKEAEAKARQSAAAAGAGGGGRGGGLPPGASFPMPYAMLPMFGMPPLNPYGGMNSALAAAAAAAQGLRPAGAMPKVSSMPAMHHGMMSPPADRDTKRKADSPIPEGTDEGRSGSPAAKRRMVAAASAETGGEGEGAGAGAGGEAPAAAPVSPETAGAGARSGQEDTPEVRAAAAAGLPPLPPPAA
jgi:hypothetical protein